MAISFTFNPFTGNFDAVSKISLAAVGSSPSANGASLSSAQVLTLQPADGTHPGLITAITQSFSGVKTFNDSIYADDGVDVTATGGTDVLALGVMNADVINIGNPGATVNIQGTTLYENVTQLQVTDPLITINKGGATGSGANSGIEIEENSAITGYAETSSDRNSWLLKAPNTAGIVTITPGASGFVIDQASHSPVTLTAVGAVPNANGASLSGQALTLQPANTSFPGVLLAADWNTFNSKQAAGNYLTALTGDVTASGPGSVAATITAHAVSNTKFRQSAGLSIVGNSTNATADVADITAASDGQVLRRSGTAVGFGAVSLSTAAAVTGALPIGNGGTGQTTKAPAFDALSPMSASGDIIYGGASGTGTRLAKGSDGQVLTLASGVPSWAAAGGATAYNYNGYHTMSSSGSWSTTATSFTAPTPSGTATLTQRLNTNFGAVTTAATNAAGITFTPPATGQYFISASLSILQGNIGFGWVAQIYDGTTGYCLSGGRSASAAAGGNEGDACNLTTILSLSTGSPITISIRLQTESGGQVLIWTGSGNNPIEWSIFKIG